ncbi:hypothetical protein VTL71DRAFT_11066, partial [Oculimacula yallundae]
MANEHLFTPHSPGKQAQNLIPSHNLQSNRSHHIAYSILRAAPNRYPLMTPRGPGNVETVVLLAFIRTLI